MGKYHIQQQLLNGKCIPKRWKLVKFGSITKIAKGQVLPDEDPYVDYIHIGPENIESGSNRIVELKTSKELGLISGKYVFDDNSIVYSKIRPNLNKVCAPNFTGLCSADAYPIWPKENALKAFLLYYMSSELFLRQSIAASMRTGMPKINREDLDMVKVLLPPLTEQIRIAEILSTWDQAILQTGKLLEVKRKLKKGLMQQLLTGKRRFPEFIKSSKTVKTHFGHFPSEWRALRVGDIAREIVTRNNSDNSVKVLSCTKHQGLVDSLEYFGKQIFSEDTSNYKLVRRGQFAYATNHIEEGSIGLLSHFDAGLVSPMYTVFETTEQVNAQFLFALFKTELYRHIFEVNTNASVNRRGSLRWKQFSRLPVFLPSLHEQGHIQSALATIDRDINIQSQKLDALNKQKRGLMQQLLTGKKRVKV